MIEGDATAYGRPPSTYQTIANVETIVNHEKSTSIKRRKSDAKHCPSPALAYGLWGRNEIPLDDIVVHEWPSCHCVRTPFVYIQNDCERRNDGESCTIYLFEVSKIGRPNLPGARSSLWPPGSKTKYPWMTSWYMSGRHVTAYGRPSYIYKTIANVETMANCVPFTSSKCRKSAAKHCQNPALASSLQGRKRNTVR